MLGSWEFTGEPGHIHIRVCESLLCGVPGRYEYIWALCRCGWRDCTDFLFSWLCFGGYGTIEMVGGGAVFSLFIFLSLLSILLAGGYAR